MRYEHRISKVIDYIGKHLDNVVYFCAVQKTEIV